MVCVQVFSYLIFYFIIPCTYFSNIIILSTYTCMYISYIIRDGAKKPAIQKQTKHTHKNRQNPFVLPFILYVSLIFSWLLLLKLIPISMYKRREKHEQQHLRGDTYIKRFAHFFCLCDTRWYDTYTHKYSERQKRKIIGNVYWIFFLIRLWIVAYFFASVYCMFIRGVVYIFSHK